MAGLVEKETLSQIRKKVDKYSKDTYLKRVQAPRAGSQPGSLDGTFVEPSARMVARTRNMNIKDVVNVNPERMSGAPCFTGTRVPISHLFEFIESGETLDEFLRQFPSVRRDQAKAALELSKESLLANYEIAA